MKNKKNLLSLIVAVAIVFTMTGCDPESGDLGDDNNPIENNNNNNNVNPTEERVIVSSNDYYVTGINRRELINAGLLNYKDELDNGYDSYKDWYGVELACVLNIKYGTSNGNLKENLSQYLTTDESGSRLTNYAASGKVITNTITEVPTSDNIEELVTKWGWDSEIIYPACNIVILTGFDNTNLNSSKNDWSVSQEELSNRLKVASAFYKSKGLKIAMYKADYDYFDYVQSVPEVSLLMTNKNNISDYYTNYRLTNNYVNFGFNINDDESLEILDTVFLNYISLEDLTTVAGEWRLGVSFDRETSVVLPDIVFEESPFVE